MATRKIQVDLTFNADTSAAKTKIANLQQQLSELTLSAKSNSIGKEMSKEISIATDAAIKLKLALNNAVNQDTGKLNFSQFNTELKRSGLSLSDLAKQLSVFGTKGMDAFSSLASSIRNAETPLFQFEGALKKLGTTFANTIRWQITASITTGMYSAFQGVIDYSERLNKSLNEIRIVTGKNVDTMAKFADEAQKAAKALNTSTLDYSKASLIYYQQGLSDSEVAKRTATTVKLANVIGESANTVSDWMTSIWNNFDDGSKSLEYYADVLAKLGAATASSADEIAGGLEKFSAIANTVGLSYEYAAAAVTTLTAETRQSEDIAGTALKTIFARLEDLKLGNSLDDGVTLGQYSGELAKVGVNILDVNGNLKDMDTILDEIIARWGKLSQGQKVSLAQSVAGIRQYSQFMALIDNSDAFKQNVERAKDATGELQKQQEIYAEGVAGAQARIKNSVEYIKNSLLDEDGLVPVLNVINAMADGVGDFINALGGLPGILTTIVALALKIWGPQAAASLQRMTDSVRNFVGGVSGKARQQQSQAALTATQLEAEITQGTAGLTGGSAYGQTAYQEFEIASKYAEVESKISAESKAQFDLHKQIYDFIKQSYIETAKKAAEEEKILDFLIQQKVAMGELTSEQIKEVEELALNSPEQSIEAFAKQKISWKKAPEQSLGSLSGSAENIITQMQNFGASSEVINKMTESWGNLQTAIEDYGKIQTTTYKTQKEQDAALKKGQNTIKKYQKAFSDLAKTYSKNLTPLKKLIDKYPEQADAIKQVYNQYLKMYQAQGEVDAESKAAQKAADELEQKLEGLANKGKSWSENLIGVVSGIAQAAAGMQMLYSGITSLGEALGNNEADFGTWLSAITSTAFGLAMILPQLQNFNGWVNEKIKLSKEAKIAQEAENAVTAEATTAEAELVTTKEAENIIDKENVVQSNANIIADKEEESQDKAHTITLLGKQIAKNPWVGLAIAAIVTALIGGVAISASITSRNREREETATKATEDFTKSKETTENNQELISNYQDLLYQYKQTGEGRNKLIESAEKLAEAYNVEGAALLKLSGDYEKFDTEIQNKRIEELAELQDKAELAISTSAYQIKSTARKGKGYALGTDYFAKFKSNYPNDIEQDMPIYAALKNLDSDLQGYLYETAEGVFLSLPDMSPEGFYKAYTAVDTVLKEASKNGAKGTSKLYSQLAAWRNKMEEKMTVYAEQRGAITSSATETAVLTTTVNGKKASELSTTEEYAQWEKAVKSAAGANFDESTFSKLVSQYGNLTDFILFSSAAKEQANKSEKMTYKSLLALYGRSSEALASAMASVDVTKGMSEEDFIKAAQKLLPTAQRNIALGIAQENEVTEDQLNTYATLLKDYNKNLQNNEALLWEVAGTAVQLNATLDTLTSTWNDNSEALLRNNVNTSEYAYAVTNIANSLKTFFGVKNENVDLSNFVRNNQELITEFMNGNYKLFDDLQLLIAKDVANTLGYGQELDSLFIMLGSKDYLVGDNLDLSPFQKKLNQMLEDGTLTAAKLSLILSGAGWSAEYTPDNKSILKITRTKDEDQLNKKYFEDKQKTAKSAKKDLEDEIERYHEINEILEDTENQLDAISKAKDRAFGPDRLKYMDQELAKQKELLNLEKKKTQEAQNYYKTDRAAILKYGASLDSSGRITNYDELFAAQVNTYNTVGQRTGWTGDTFEKQQKSYEAFKKAISQYEETLNLIEDQQQKVVDMQNELADLALEKIQFQVEFKINIEEDKLKYIEFLMQKFEDDSFAAAESIGLLGREASSALTKIKAAEEGISAIMSDVRSSGIMTDAQAEALRDYRDNIIDLNSQLLELRNTVQDKLTAAFDAWNEKLDKNTSKLSHLRNLVNNYKNIIDIVGKDNLGISDETMEKIRVTQMKTANDQLTAAKAAMGAAKETLSQYEAARDAASARGDQESVKEWNKQIETVEEKLRELTENFQTTWADALQAVADAFESRVDQIVENFSESVSGIYKNLDELSEFMDREKEIDERYLDNFEKVYEINKLNREVNSSINNAASEVTAKKLRDFQEDLLAMQEEGVKVSKYDVEFMQKKYDLLVAEAALQDAQNAKSVVRLRRDSEGNFGYVYTADQDTVANAQQKYDDALYAMQKFGKESLQTAQEQIIGIEKAYADAIKQLQADTALTQEEKAKKMAELTQYYSEQLKYWVDEANKRTQEGLDINTSFNAGMAESFEQTLLQKIFPDINNWEQLYEDAQSNMQKAGQEFVDACGQYSIETGESFDKAGQKASDMDTAISKALDKISEKSEETADDTEDMADDMVSAMQKAVDSVESFQRTYSSQMQQVRDANQKTIESVNELIAKYQGMINKANEAAKVDLSAPGKATAGSSGGGDKVSYTPSDGSKQYTSNEKSYALEKTTTVNGTKYYQLSVDGKSKWYKGEDVTYLSGGIGKVGSIYSIKSGAKDYTPNVHYTDDNRIQLKGYTKGAFSIQLYDTRNGMATSKLEGKDVGDFAYIIGYRPYKSGDGNWYRLGTAKGKATNAMMKQSDLHKLLGIEGALTPARDGRLKLFDTGGYTGSWGTDGRLALLHQKELVLNASDTENFLSAVSILRDITSQIDLQAASMSYSNILDSMRFTAGAQRDTLEQNVTIHAEFPNATDHSEIEQAFQNLSNLASQYAGRKV